MSYKIKRYRVVDGDSVKCTVELWPGLEQTVNVRIDGVNTPEKRTRDLREKAAGIAATKFSSEFLKGKQLELVNVSLGKFAGRVLGNITADGALLSEALIEHGHAREYHGGKRGPWFA